MYTLYINAEYFSSHCRPDNFFFNFHSGGGVHFGSTRHVGHFWSIVPAPGDCEGGEFGGMKIGTGNQNTKRKPAQVPRLSIQKVQLVKNLLELFLITRAFKTPVSRHYRCVSCLYWISMLFSQIRVYDKRHKGDCAIATLFSMLQNYVSTYQHLNTEICRKVSIVFSSYTVEACESLREEIYKRLQSGS
jgi:hypothetical protein